MEKQTQSGKEDRGNMNRVNQATAEYVQARVIRRWDIHRLKLAKCKKQLANTRNGNPSSSKIVVDLADS